MKQVSVDLKDLEALVFVTGAIKSIEQTLAQRKRDPWVKPHLDFTEAHDRLASAMRNAYREDADTMVQWNEPLTDEENKLLREIEREEDQYDIYTIHAQDRIPKAGQDMTTYDRLAAKGMIKLGQIARGIVWPGAVTISDVRAEPKYAIQITQRGRAVLGEKKAIPSPSDS